MDGYQARALEGASGIELTIALYDGIIRFMHNAIDAADQGDAVRRRHAVKRAMDIVIHLQATLNMSLGGKPAETLAEFYTAMFALMLQGSQANSRHKFEQVIACVRNVREAWAQAMRSPELLSHRPLENLTTAARAAGEFAGAPYADRSTAVSHWNA